MKTLIVDDSSAGRRILRHYLERRGCTIIEASNGEEGLDMARKHPLDLIISDALMPKMDGFQFLRALKGDKALQNIPFIFYSSIYTGSKDEELGRSLGANGFIIKPKGPEEFWAEVNAVLNQEQPSKPNIKTELYEAEEEYLRQYASIVTAKIEEKVKELEQANVKLRLRAKGYRNLLNSIRDVIISTDDQRSILDANQPALRETFGYELEDITGRNASVLYGDQEAYEAAGTALASLTPHDRGKLLELNFRNKGGEMFIGELYLTRRLGEEGVPTGNLGIIRDISERKRAQEALRASEEERYQLQAELTCAAEVQAKLLPGHFPAIPGFDIAGSCLPAHQVGGDFYDWLEVAPGIIAITLGDVMGKGMAAAMLMATVRATVHTATLENRPAAALTLAEQALSNDLERSESFVTLFHAHLDVAERCLTYVDCGHGHVFLRRAGGSIEDLHPRGLPLGVTSKESCQEGSITFRPGDILVLYSDGLIDARPEMALNKELLASHLDGASTAQEMVERLMALPALEGAPPDDLTVLVARCSEDV